MSGGLVLGLDCGGSTIRARVENCEGATFFEGSAGPANLATTPVAVILEHLRIALKGCPPVEQAAMCMAGLLTDSDQRKAKALLKSVLDVPKVFACPDYYATVAADPEADVVVIAGTGVAIASMRDGVIRKSGGGGFWLGDQGSAASIGRAALAAFLVPANPPPMTDRFRETANQIYGANTGNELLAAVYRTPSPAATIACLAPAIVFDWVDGEAYAKSCVEGPVESLAREVQGHLTTFLPEKSQAIVGLTGGVWSIHPSLFVFMERLLGESGLKVRRSEVDPLAGAIRLAHQIKSDGN
ncbi:MAG: hypothetical protein KF812_06195 [Fimbriimonadaceae bacterium]|nr:hypothetical protein [Fimbriimonadaceae bacterium]